MNRQKKLKMGEILISILHKPHNSILIIITETEIKESLEEFLFKE